MKRILSFLLRHLFWALLSLRYKIEVKGLEKFTKEQLKGEGGILFLPNHTSILVDPLATALAILGYYSVRPLVVEYMYYLPGVHFLMKLLRGLPVPNFNTASNSIKKKRSERVLEQLIDDLKKGDNFLIYPSGRIKRTAVEVVGGASAVHNILQKTPEANIVLVRISGLWGSSFSRALIGQTPNLFKTLLQGAKYILANFIFFSPRRLVTFEFMPAPSDFPRCSSRLELNTYLDKWYNNYSNGLDPQTGGEPLTLIPYTIWSRSLPSIEHKAAPTDNAIDLLAIPEEIQCDVKNKLSEISKNAAEAIDPEMNLSTDLGLDSLDIAEVILFLQDKYDIKSVPVDELDTVGKVMAIASHQISVGEAEVELQQRNRKAWFKYNFKHETISVYEGETIVEVFLRSCEENKNRPACADDIAGVLSYSQLKMRVLLLADHFRNYPGEYIGVLLPASVTAYAVVLACQVANKIPLMINWTVGPAHLQAILKLTDVQKIVTAWSFIERLSNVNLEGIDERLVMLEDVRRSLTLKDKLKALYRSKRSVKSILETFDLQGLSKESPAVLLFTSGTESMPKGVPLSHDNILSNQRAALKLADVYYDDIMLGVLPPFHAFGFTVSGLMPILGGIRVAYSPDPTDGRRLAKGVEDWAATMMCGAPTFLKSMLKSATPEQVKTMRFLVTGAEKAPPELYELVKKVGKEGHLFEGYGITECSPIITLNCPNLPICGVGRCLPDVEMITVHPENFQPYANRLEQGLLLVRGPSVFQGYLNKDVSSPFVEINGLKWYNTGDLGSLNEKGYLTLSGRLKRFVKVGGEMVSLSSIEEALKNRAEKNGWPQSEEGPSIAISAREIPGEKTKIFLFTTFEVETETANKALREAGFSNLVRITEVKRLKEIPIMGTGKVHYRRLESEYLPI